MCTGQQYTSPAYGYHSPGSASRRLARSRALALGLALVLFAGCVPTTKGHSVPPPTLPAPALLGIADGGRDSLSQIVQLGADPAHQRVFILAGHQFFGPVVSAPWADHLVAVDHATGAHAWQFGTPTTDFTDRAHQLSGMVVDPLQGRVILATSQQALALRANDGSIAVSVPLPPTLDCVGFAALEQQPTLDAYGRALFACTRGEPEQTPVGALVDLSKRTVTLVPPPIQGIPNPGPGIHGHIYVVAADGLRVFAGEPQSNTPPIAELPFNVANLATALLVETQSDGAPTGRVYLAGIGAQVAILDDAAPATLGAQNEPLAATILAERAVALTVDPARYRGTPTLPTLPNFLVAPGQFAHTFCFGPTQPFSPNSVTMTTAASQSPDGTGHVDLRISVLDARGSETGARHWIVAVATDGTGTILTDDGSVDPFMPTPPVPCPIWREHAAA